MNLLSNDISRIKESNCTKTNCSGNGSCDEKEFTCKCNPDFFAPDCSVSDENEFRKYVELKKNLYNKLQELLNKQTSTAVQDQI